ncbi:translation initiation factor IF-2-like [Grus japonensis]|uniref:Translation initiation factor IF-2-like n=1 Tax=Grus japonensis TaxID=30415 RepID=A0ABC9W804_GRUJA
MRGGGSISIPLLSRLQDPQCQPPGQPGPCCGGCHAGGTLAHEGPLWGAWPSPSCCWDAREGCAGSALPYSCHPRWPGGPGVPARSVESLTSSVFSAAISSDSTASSPAPCCPSAEGPVEETLSAVLASCRLSAGAAIDRRSFIASGLASQLLEELLCQQLPGAEPGPTAGPEEWCCTTTTTTTSLERLRQHDHRFQRTKVCFQEQGWVPAAGTDRDTKVTPCRGQPWECRCAGGQDQGSGAQPCREACGHLCRGVAWHATHGCCARVEAGPSGTPRCCDGELAHGCGSAPGCPPGWWSRGGGREEPRSRQRAGKRDVARSHHGHREREEMPMLESWSRGQEPSGQRQEDGERQPPAPVHGGCPEWDPSPCPGTTNMVRVIARSFELRAQQDAARAERERQAWRCRGAGTADSPPQEPPECSGGQGWLPAEEHGTAGAQAATEPCRGGTAGSHDGEEGRRHGGYSRAPRC